MPRMGIISVIHTSAGIMTGTLGLLLLLLPLAAPLIAQDTVKRENDLPETKECQFYNATCANTEEGCPLTELCNLSDQSSHAGCSVTWTNTSTEGVIIGFKGCMYYDTSCTEKCISHQIDRGNRSSQNVHYYYCCCLGSNCNKEFTWDPQETEVTTTTPPTRINTSSGVLQAILLTLGVLMIIFIIAPVIFYCYRRQKMANFLELPTVESTALTHPCASLHQPSKIQIQLIEVKARGRFGAVWKARYCNTDVAVKIFPVQDKQSWMLEKKIFSLAHMRHENILSFIGAEENGNHLTTEYWLITAYHDHGSLYDYLKCNVMTWAEACHIGESLARGLSYLHCEQPATKSEGLKPAIAHRDFKSKNVLLKSDLRACIADFGLAITFYPGQVIGETHGQVGTRRYMAPEVLEGAISFHRDAFLPIDMYACGLVLWEIASRCTAQDGPICEYRLPFEDEVGQHPTLDDMQECVVTRRMRPQIADTWLNHPGLKAIVMMMQESWDHDAEARLSASCIAERFALLSRQPQLKHNLLFDKEASF